VDNRQHIFCSEKASSVVEILKMKQFTLSEDRTVIVKKEKGQHIVVVKQKDSDVKYAEFTPNRFRFRFSKV